jgi:MFS family permease
MHPLSLPVLVAALGYFVDIYDIVIFGVTRGPSLKDLGIAPDQVNAVGQMIFNGQMVGMLLGGVLWGVLGDRVGRIQALWGCIILYSLANLACAGLGHYGTWMPVEQQYLWLRFIAGVGLAAGAAGPPPWWRASG